MKAIKKIFAVLLAVAMVAVLFAGCGGNGGSGTKYLKLGFDPEFPPMGFKDDSGDYVGFDIDVANEAVKLIDGYDEIKLVPIDWDSKDSELKSGNIDMIWNGFTMNVNGNEDSYEWTKPYMVNAQVVVVGANSDIKDFAALSGKIVAAQKDSSGLSALNKADFVSTVKEVKEIASYESALMELEQGSIDAVVIDEIVINYKIGQGADKYKVLDQKLGGEEYGIAFLKGNTELRDKVQAALGEMAYNGKLAEISEKWFGTDITTVEKVQMAQAK